MREKSVVPALTTQLLMKALIACGSRSTSRLELHERNEGAELERLGQRLDRVHCRPKEGHKGEDRSRGQERVDEMRDPIPARAQGMLIIARLPKARLLRICLKNSVITTETLIRNMIPRRIPCRSRRIESSSDSPWR